MNIIKIVQSATALSLIAAIAGCSSSSSSSSTQPGESDGFQTTLERAAALRESEEFDELTPEQQEIVVSIIGVGELSAPDTLPATAYYTGGLLVANDEFLADATLGLTVGFDDGDVSGAITSVLATDLIDGESFTLPGTLDVNGSVTGNELTAGISGTLTAEGTLDVTGNMSGEFRGADADEGAGGIVLIIGDDEETQTLDGGWHVSRE